MINCIKSEWGYSEGLSDKLLALKLVMLMALTSASAIHSSAKHLLMSNKIHRPHKSWRCGKLISSLEFHEYSEDKSL